MEKIPNNQHRMILVEIFVKSKPYQVKLVLNNDLEIIGSVQDIVGDSIIIKTISGTAETDFYSIQDAYYSKNN